MITSSETRALWDTHAEAEMPIWVPKERVRLCVCVCVCVYPWVREGEREREKWWESGLVGEPGNMSLRCDLLVCRWALWTRHPHQTSHLPNSSLLTLNSLTSVYLSYLPFGPQATRGNHRVQFQNSAKFTTTSRGLRNKANSYNW